MHTCDLVVQLASLTSRVSDLTSTSDINQKSPTTNCSENIKRPNLLAVNPSQNFEFSDSEICGFLVFEQPKLDFSVEIFGEHNVTKIFSLFYFSELEGSETSISGLKKGKVVNVDNENLVEEKIRLFDICICRKVSANLSNEVIVWLCLGHAMLHGNGSVLVWQHYQDPH